MLALAGYRVFLDVMTTVARRQLLDLGGTVDSEETEQTMGDGLGQQWGRMPRSRGVGVGKRRWPVRTERELESTIGPNKALAPSPNTDHIVPSSFSPTPTRVTALDTSILSSLCVFNSNQSRSTRRPYRARRPPHPPPLFFFPTSSDAYSALHSRIILSLLACSVNVLNLLLAHISIPYPHLTFAHSGCPNLFPSSSV
ncbi:hypothetical protein VKT23_001697 [Stygiomarasmius scandens]|uniref:Uncharacterized protein n=1 Tax=Marasmiellus scandens TaxID=2682957 RepID=A0ABR1K077_9AGAR